MPLLNGGTIDFVRLCNASNPQTASFRDFYEWQNWSIIFSLSWVNLLHLVFGHMWRQSYKWSCCYSGRAVGAKVGFAAPWSGTPRSNDSVLQHHGQGLLHTKASNSPKKQQRTSRKMCLVKWNRYWLTNLAYLWALEILNCSLCAKQFKLFGS